MKEDTPSYRRHLKALETKEKILNAAIHLMETHGFDQLKVKNICELAGVSNGTFFYHFNTKEALMDYYLTDKFSKYRNEHSPKKTDDYIENIINVYKSYSEYCSLAGIDFVSNYYTPKNIALDTRQYIATVINDESIIGEVYNILHTALIDGYIKPDTDIKVLSGHICTINKGIMFEWCLIRGELNSHSLYDAIYRRYLQTYATDLYFTKYNRLGS